MQNILRSGNIRYARLETTNASTSRVSRDARLHIPLLDKIIVAKSTIQPISPAPAAIIQNNTYLPQPTMPPQAYDIYISDEKKDSSMSEEHSAPPPTEMTPSSTQHQANKNGGRHLRWTRITKSVELKEIKTGLLRGSIAGTSAPPPPDANPSNDSTIDNEDDVELGSTVASKRSMMTRTASVMTAAPVPIKTILNGISGSASPGEILALMGPSGSGKTSALDVLSGRSSYDSGVITLDTEIVTERVMKKMKKRVAYVKQSDLFFEHLTVRDQLTYTAFLRLPSTWKKERKVVEVERIIGVLRLDKCADTPISQISGGEKKRVNIGSELLTDPSIILLDEPTSGLDSTSAVALMQILHNLAKDEGKTIITSIHQPSSAVFFGFDKLMLLADGNVVYFGTPEGSLEHVKELGLDCPAGYNAADHMMDLLVVDSAIDEEDEGKKGGADDFTDNTSPADNTGLRQRRNNGIMERRQTTGGTTTKQRLINSWDGEAVAKRIEEEVAEESSVGNLRSQLSRRQSITTTESFNSTWWTQYTVLVHRSMKNSRSAIFTKLNLIKAGAIGFMCGLLWFQMPWTESAVFDRSSYYFFTMTYWVCHSKYSFLFVKHLYIAHCDAILFFSQKVFDAMFTAYMAFPLERAIIFKERSSGAYHLSAYFMAKTTSEAPARLILPTIYMIISYWMGGLNNNFGIFLASTCCSLLSVLAGESMGLFVGAAVLDMEQGMVVMTVVSLGLMVVGGFFVRNVPSWILWLGYLSPFKYSYNSSVQLVFNKPVPCDGSGLLSACEGQDTGYATEEEVLDYLGVEWSAGLNAALLLVMFVVIRVLAFFALKSKKADERM